MASLPCGAERLAEFLIKKMVCLPMQHSYKTPDVKNRKPIYIKIHIFVFFVHMLIPPAHGQIHMQLNIWPCYKHIAEAEMSWLWSLQVDRLTRPFFILIRQNQQINLLSKQAHKHGLEWEKGNAGFLCQGELILFYPKQVRLDFKSNIK